MEARHHVHFYNDGHPLQHPFAILLSRVAKKNCFEIENSNSVWKKNPSQVYLYLITTTNSIKIIQKKYTNLMSVWKLQSVFLKQNLHLLLQWCAVRTSLEKLSFLLWSCFLWVRWNCCLCFEDCSWQISAFSSCWLKHKQSSQPQFTLI